MRKQAQISPPPFFCGCRLSAAAAGSHPPQKFPRWGQIHRKQGGECAEAGTNFPTAFFFAAVACRRQRLEAIPPTTAKSTVAAGVQLVGFEGSSSGDGKIPVAAGVQLAGIENSSRSDGKIPVAAGVQLAGLENSKRGQVFSWPGSSSEGGNVKERKRENPIFAAGKIMPWPSVALIDPSHRPQIKGAGGGRRRRKKRRAAADKTAL